MKLFSCIRIEGPLLAAVSSGLLVLLGAVSQAAALPIYPAVIDGALGVSCGSNSSRCLTCHATAAGGRNTATRPFANTILREFGFGRDSNSADFDEFLLDCQSSVADAMQEPVAGGAPVSGGPPVPGGNGGAEPEQQNLVLMELDSDEDGESDWDELCVCGNPSGDEYGVPEYGCDGGSFTGSSQPGNFGWAGLLLLALAVGSRSRRRRAR